MKNNFLHDRDFANLMEFHIKEIIELLIQKGKFFSILTNIADVYFEPQLPEHITKTFKPMTLFYIAEYTFESSSIDNEFFYFETGFGEENIGSYVTVPLSSIIQIIVDDSPIFINLSVKEKREKSIKKSTNIFLSNPENKKLLKKEKK